MLFLPIATQTLQTIAYIDAFNLYFGALKYSGCKWLNVEAWLDRQFPKNTITAIKYFTARVKPLDNDTGPVLRQADYLNALTTLSRVRIIEGHYLVKEAKAMLAAAPAAGSRTVRIVKIEEKQSDVNIACEMLLDAFRGNFQAAIVVSGDGDLTTPIRMVKDEFGKPVVVLNPQRRSSYHLCQVATRYRGTHFRWDARTQQDRKIRNDGVRLHLLQSSQFPQQVTLDNGHVVARPAGW